MFPYINYECTVNERQVMRPLYHLKLVGIELDLSELTGDSSFVIIVVIAVAIPVNLTLC